MHTEDAEYTALRTEIVHYDRSCLTILGSLLTLSTAVYGLVAQSGTFYLLLILSVIWTVGFQYIVDKRASILRIALYLQIYFDGLNRNFWWESWLVSDGLCLSAQNPTQVQHHKGLSLLPIKDPVHVEFILLLVTLLVNTIGMWMLSLPGAEVETLTPLEVQPLVQFLAIVTTLFSLGACVWSARLVARYKSFDRQGFVEICRQHRKVNGMN